MKKHLLIHGDSMSGKSLFIKAFLSKHYPENYGLISARNPKAIQKPNFDFSKEYGAIWFLDVNMKITPYNFIPFTLGIKSNLKSDNPLSFKPYLIIEYSEELKALPEDQSFTGRFHIINTNTVKYAELIDFLNNHL